MSESADVILVTGATGYIGSRLTRQLLATEGVSVRALVRDPAKAADLQQWGAEIAVGDLTDVESLMAAVQGTTRIYHAAACVDEQASKSELWSVNVEGTQNLVEAALAAGMPHFIHLSSCAVYGSVQLIGIDEQTPIRTGASPYHDSKVAAEEVVWAAIDRGLPMTIARPSQVYGPGSPNFTIRPVEAIRSGSMMLVDGGRFLCKPVYIDNLLDGLELIADRPQALGQAFNLVDGYAVPWRLFFGAYAHMLGRPSLPSVPFPIAWLAAWFFEIKASAQGRRPALTRRTVMSLRSTNTFSNGKARRLLGWKPRIGFEEGMRRTANWLDEAGYLS
ncbi:MAG: NAD-dependent epimerase/dehydratase family protein [Anaerolineales bacterium]